MARKRIQKDETEDTGGGRYFAAPSSNIEFISSGCCVLDCVLGGGWAVNRIGNIVGDSGSGKTLLAIEACANFAFKYPDGMIWYDETEAAFDDDYAEALGFPVDRVEFIDDDFTVEDAYASLLAAIEYCKNNDVHGLFVIDSLDALSDKAEQDRKIDDGTYGASKARKLSEFFRRVTKAMSGANITLLVVSQVRENIGVSFGEKYTRAGGKALQFYCSQVLWLAQTGKIKKTVKGVDRVTGVAVKALCKKNKIGLPFRDCAFNIVFGYGIDDVHASLLWLQGAGMLKELGMDIGGETQAAVTNYVKSMQKMGDDEFVEAAVKINDTARRLWEEIESSFLPTRRKYGR